MSEPKKTDEALTRLFWETQPCGITALLDAAAEAILLLAPDGTALYANLAATKTLGWSRDEIVGKPLLDGRILPAPLVEAWLRTCREAVAPDARPEPWLAEKTSLVDRQGRERVFEARLVPIQDSDGGFLGLAALLCEAERLHAEYAAHLMHDLKTPVTTILAASDLLLNRARRSLEAVDLKHLEGIRRNANSLLQTANNYLDMAKLKHGKFRPRAVRVDLKDLLSEVAAEVEPLFHQRGLAFETRVDEGVPGRIWADPEGVFRILTNLLTNACKFTESGGASLSVSAAGGELRFTVQDTGIGMTAEEIPTIFREFFRVGEGNSGRRGGSGLGLPIADRFSRLMGGRIEVASEPGRGSRFTFVLPLQTAEPPSS
jgi:PAS domain S-box-containing protein